MKRFILILAISLAAGLQAGADGSDGSGSEPYSPSAAAPKRRPMKNRKIEQPKWAFQSNLAGFVQFGPDLTVEYSPANRFVLNGHVRFPSLGALTKVANEEDTDEGGRPDQYSGYVFGGGAYYTFDNKKDKVYMGLLFDYEMAEMLFLEGYYEERSREEKNMILMLNGGYRFRFNQKLRPGPYRKADQFIREGLFVNTGFYLGAIRSNYSWDYTDPNAGVGDTSPRNGIEFRPYGMIEISVGIEF